MGSFDFLEEPRPAARRRGRRAVPVDADGAAKGEAAALHLSLQRRWHAGPSLGFVKSFKPVDSIDGSGPMSRCRSTAAATSRRTFGARRAPTRRMRATSDPDAKLYRKGPGMEAKLAFLGHALMENRCGLLVDACLTPADGHAERVAALAMIEPRADPCRGDARC